MLSKGGADHVLEIGPTSPIICLSLSVSVSGLISINYVSWSHFEDKYITFYLRPGTCKHLKNCPKEVF